ncbi:hypothetical protein [Wenjunlia tyrosinilytica]|nr:hypothetical protein [Wenjunlia tyrosinilytica]
MRRTDRVRVPWRVISSAAYPDSALAVYIKVKALAMRPEACTAGVAVLAAYLRLSKRTVERGLSALSNPDPHDGVVELLSQRRTKPGGQGTTALRSPRKMNTSERFVWVPVAAADDLDPRQLRAWAALAYAQAQNMQVSESELGELLRHHRGSRAGQPVGAACAGSTVDALEARGWLTVQRRAGRQGRHLFTVVQPTGSPSKTSMTGDDPNGPRTATDDPRRGSASGGGSGSPSGGGSLATKEDHLTDRHDHDAAAPCPPAAGEIPLSRRNVPTLDARTPHVAASSANLALRAAAAPPTPTPTKRPSAPGGHRRPYTGPPLTYNPRISWVLEPLRSLIPRTTVYIQRQIAREVGAQLALGTEPARLRERLQLRLARTDPAQISNVGGWIIKAALPRWGCYDPKCESGIRWATGQACQVCLAERAHRKAEQSQRADHVTTAASSTEPCATTDPQVPAEAGPQAPTSAASRRLSSSGDETAFAGTARCPDCGRRQTDRHGPARCGPCADACTLGHIVTQAMDAAGHGLTGRAKLDAAAVARDDVLQHADSARTRARAAGQNESQQTRAVLQAARNRVFHWEASTVRPMVAT